MFKRLSLQLHANIHGEGGDGSMASKLVRSRERGDGMACCRVGVEEEGSHHVDR